MKLTTLLLSAALALGLGMSGAVLAHDGGWRGHGDYGGHRHYQRDHGRHAQHRDRRHWRHDHHAYRPQYRPHYRPAPQRDSWYGIHLFLGGH